MEFSSCAVQTLAKNLKHGLKNERAKPMRIRIIFLTTVVICAMFTRLAVAQDFQRDYSLPSGSNISIRNISGNIKVVGYDGNNVIVTAYKEGRDRDRVEIIDASDERNIDIYVSFPLPGNIDAGVDFEIWAPRNIPYNYGDLSSVSGDIAVSMVAGKVHTGNISGHTEVLNVYGAVSANSISGDIYVQIADGDGKGNLSFASISGDVIVRAPADLDACVELSTLIGLLWTDFPIRVSGRAIRIGYSATGRLGNGTRSLKISSISGRVCLLKK